MEAFLVGFCLGVLATLPLAVTRYRAGRASGWRDGRDALAAVHSAPPVTRYVEVKGPWPT